MLKLFLTRGNDVRGTFLELPASPADIGVATVMLDCISDDVPSTRISRVVSNVTGIAPFLKKCNIYDSVQLGRLNQLAVKIKALSPTDCEKLSGAWGILGADSFDSLFSAFETLDKFDFFLEVSSEHELGIYLVESGEMDFPQSTIPYLDFTKIGDEYYANHSVCYTNHGLVVMTEDAPVQEMNTEPQGMKMEM